MCVVVRHDGIYLLGGAVVCLARCLGGQHHCNAELCDTACERVKAALVEHVCCSSVWCQLP